MRVRRSAQPPSLAHHDRSRAPEPGETRRPSELPPSEKATLYCAKGESPRELPLLLSCTFLPRAPATKRFPIHRNDAKPRRSRIKKKNSRNARRSCRSRPRFSLVFVGCSTHARIRVVRSRGARARAHPAGLHDTRPRRPRTSPSRGETRGSLRVRDVARDGGHDAEKEPVRAERYLSRSVRRSRASRCPGLVSAMAGPRGAPRASSPPPAAIEPAIPAARSRSRVRRACRTAWRRRTRRSPPAAQR